MIRIMVVVVSLLLAVDLGESWAGFCDPLPPPAGQVEIITTENQIRERAIQAEPGTTLLIEPGLYLMAGYVHFVNSGVTMRSSSGNRDDVILDFGGMLDGHFGILVEADDVTIADLTIRNAAAHGVSISGTDAVVLYNLHIVDVNDQLVKVNPIGDGSEDGLLACSLLEYTDADPDGYTNGISAHNAHRWTVRDNTWRRIRTYNEAPAPTILFWSGSSGTVVERNLLVDCYQGISFGNASHGSGDHLGGIVRNNVIYSRLKHDVAIEMVHAAGWLVAHNSVLLMDPEPGLTWGIEARFSDSSGHFYNNLATMDIWADRDGADGTASGTVIVATPAWFVDPEAFDFRLTSRAGAAIDQGAVVPDELVTADYWGESRDALPDAGADEWQPALGDVITILQIVAGESTSSDLASDIDGDDRTGLPEALFLLDRLMGRP